MKRLRSQILERSFRKKFFTWLLEIALFGTGFFYLFFLVNCRHYRFSFVPLPSKIESLEGYASLNISGERGKAKSKFSFLFLLPDQGRIEVFDLLGRRIYSLFIEEEEAFFVLPSKKVYWQGKREEIIDKFLGFALSPKEMGHLLSGQWEGMQMEWNLEKDDKGRVVAGNREELRFEVKEFFAQSSMPRLVFFNHSLDRGRLKIFTINFNQPIKGDVFRLSFLDDFVSKTWEEIERMLDNEN